MSMKLRERYFKVREAELEIGGEFIALVTKHDLTYGEILSILGKLTSDYSKFLIRFERHGDESKKGDEA